MSSDRENSLRLGARELNKLVSDLDQKNAQEGSKQGANREHVRRGFCEPHAELIVDHPGGSRQALIVATRDLSRRGIGVLHSSFVYEGTRCEVSFRTGDGEPVRVHGRVTRCALLTGRVHEIGIQFDEEISIRDVLGLDPMREAYSLERIDPGALHGSVLVVAGSELEQRLIIKMLEETSLHIGVADGIERACEKAVGQSDMVLCDAAVGASETGVDLVTALRAAGYDAPIVVIGSGSGAGSGPGSKSLDELRMAGASGYLSKPLTAGKLFQAIGEFLIADGDGGPMFSSLQNDDPMYDLVAAFLRELPRISLEIEAAMRGNDAEAALSACRALSGSGEPLGFKDLGDLAVRAEASVSATGSVRGGGSDLRALLIACRRVKNRPLAG